MRYLRDSEVLKWGKELKMNLVPRYSPYGGIDISIGEYPIVANTETYHIDNNDLSKNKMYKSIKYDFTFSISENRVVDFERFLEKNKDFNSKIVIDNESEIGSKYIDIEYLDELNNFTTEKHQLYNRTYVRYKYEFNCNFTSIIAVVTLLKDAIDYIAMIWGYDEKGNEIKLSKYNIGDIVSIIKNKSKDYLIIDNKIRFTNLSGKAVGRHPAISNKKELVYILSEIITDEKSSVIRYGDVLELFEESLCFSRNDRINNILN